MLFIFFLGTTFLLPSLLIGHEYSTLPKVAYQSGVPCCKIAGYWAELPKAGKQSAAIHTGGPTSRKEELKQRELEKALEEAQATLVEIFRLWDEAYNFKDRLLKMHDYGIERSRLAISLGRFAAQAGRYRPKCCGEGLKILETMLTSRKVVYIYAQVVLHRTTDPYREIRVQRRFRMVLEDRLWRTSLGWFMDPK